MKIFTNANNTWQLLQHKEFRAYLLMRFFVIFSLYAQSTALAYYLYNITHHVKYIGYIGLAEIIPAFLFSLPAGHFADKNNKQKMLRIIVLIYVIISASIFYCTSGLHVWRFSTTLIIIYSLIFMNGACRAFLAPVSFSILGALTPKNNNASAITWSTTAWYLGSIIGPLAGGALLAATNMQMVSGMSTICLLFAFVCTWRITSKPALMQNIKEPIWQSLQKGLQFVFGTEIILACLSIDLFAVLFGGAEALLPVFTKDILHASATEFGWLRSAHGLGSILLTGILAFIPLQQQAGKKLMWSVAGFGLCMIGFALSKNFYISFVWLFLGGMLDCVSVVIRQSVLQAETPVELKGRVASVNMLFISSSNELGTVESSLAAQYFGTIPSVIYGGIATLLVVIITFIKAPSLRKLILK
jgi:MFS family permease